ncbi:HD domain-containing phosphohydrolase [Desulfurobacterium atlanticum]|uniref:Putative two-component system response regulator n=1 Tax=Desulfurobacterium atlanticum TaxID=240169 RepID=A0A238ZTD2_9BACT|nr:HD domain-containing phosphohydrolase [Desulfurobacterium atlanticum]SNR86687.1 putative two-component system response regulator [Desulfurobacterium atlanticum]
MEKVIKILIVDDEPFNVNLMDKLVRKAIKRSFSIFDFKITKTVSPTEALESIKSSPPHLLITDIMMPEIDGYQLIKEVRKLYNMEELKIIVVTSLEDRDSRIRALLAGANDYTVKPVDAVEFPIRIMNNIKLIENYLLLKDRTLLLENAVKEATKEIREREREIIFRLAEATEYKDAFTGNHIHRVAEYCKLIAEGYGCDKSFIESIYIASPLHDIGKIAIPEKILGKPGKLTQEEFEIMKKHTIYGANLLKGTKIPLLQFAQKVALYHHEKWNGKGYPEGLKEKEIPLEARITAIADVFDALTSVRPYKKAFPFEKAMEIIKEEIGKSFDPELATIFIEEEKEVYKIYKTFSSLKGEVEDATV